MPHAQYEYEKLSAFNKFAVLYLGLLAALHQQIAPKKRGRPPFVDREGFLSAAKNLAPYFIPQKTRKKPKQIRAGNLSTEREIARFLADMSDAFMSGIARRNIPNELQALYKQLKHLNSFAELKIPFGGALERSPRKDHNDARPPANADKLSEQFLRLVKSSFPNAHHPRLPGLPLDCEQALATEFFALAEAPNDDSWKKTGLFVVIREARGPYTNEGRDVNIIVRDLLWLRRQTGPDPSDEVKNDKNAHGGQIGFYFSALDGVVYEVRNIVVRNSMTMIDARSFMDTGIERSLCMYYPDSAITIPLSLREGVVLGTTRDQMRPGAWKFLLLRPDWPDTKQLDTSLSAYLDFLSSGIDRPEYDGTIVRCFEFVRDSGAIGVLYSRQWERLEGTTTLRNTRVLFRRLLWRRRASARRDRIFLGSRIDATIEEAIAEQFPKLAQTQDPKGIQKILVDAIRTILTENWELIEPPQIISSGFSTSGRRTEPELQLERDLFLRRSEIMSYEAYAEKFPNNGGESS